MITGTHLILYTADAEADRAFFRDVLRFPSVDAGDGWLIFAAPPAEIAMHPGENGSHEIYLMCDDVEALRRDLRTKGVETTAVTDRGYGLFTSLTLPGGGSLSIYQPRHPVAAGGS